jgi:hypothetical protein
MLHSPSSMILLLAYALYQSQGMEAAGFAKPKEAFGYWGCLQ